MADRENFLIGSIQANAYPKHSYNISFEKDELHPYMGIDYPDDFSITLSQKDTAKLLSKAEARLSNTAIRDSSTLGAKDNDLAGHRYEKFDPAVGIMRSSFDTVYYYNPMVTIDPEVVKNQTLSFDDRLNSIDPNPDYIAKEDRNHKITDKNKALSKEVFANYDIQASVLNEVISKPELSALNVKLSEAPKSADPFADKLQNDKIFAESGWDAPYADEAINSKLPTKETTKVATNDSWEQQLQQDEDKHIDKIIQDDINSKYSEPDDAYYDDQFEQLGKSLAAEDAALDTATNSDAESNFIKDMEAYQASYEASQDAKNEATFEAFGKEQDKAKHAAQPEDESNDSNDLLNDLDASLSQSTSTSNSSKPLSNSSHDLDR